MPLRSLIAQSNDQLTVLSTVIGIMPCIIQVTHVLYAVGLQEKKRLVLADISRQACKAEVQGYARDLFHAISMRSNLPFRKPLTASLERQNHVVR